MQADQEAIERRVAVKRGGGKRSSSDSNGSGSGASSVFKLDVEHQVFDFESGTVAQSGG